MNFQVNVVCTTSKMAACIMQAIDGFDTELVSAEVLLPSEAAFIQNNLSVFNKMELQEDISIELRGKLSWYVHSRTGQQLANIVKKIPLDASFSFDITEQIFADLFLSKVRKDLTKFVAEQLAKYRAEWTTRDAILKQIEEKLSTVSNRKLAAAFRNGLLTKQAALFLIEEK